MKVVVLRVLIHLPVKVPALLVVLQVIKRDRANYWNKRRKKREVDQVLGRIAKKIKRKRKRIKKSISIGKIRVRASLPNSSKMTIFEKCWWSKNKNS